MGLFFSSATVGAMHFQKMTQTKMQVTLIDTYLMEIEFNADMDYVCLTDHKAKAQNKEKKPISHSLIGKTHPEKKAGKPKYWLSFFCCSLLIGFKLKSGKVFCSVQL